METTIDAIKEILKIYSNTFIAENENDYINEFIDYICQLAETPVSEYLENNLYDIESAINDVLLNRNIAIESRNEFDVDSVEYSLINSIVGSFDQIFADLKEEEDKLCV